MNDNYDTYIGSEKSLGCLPGGLIITGLMGIVFVGPFWQSILLGLGILLVYQFFVYAQKNIKIVTLNSRIPLVLLTVFLFLGNIFVVAGPKIINGLTDPIILADKIRERNKYTFSGSICRDGTTSHSQGRGTCSWHKGVRRKFYKGQFIYSKSESLKVARELSWLD